MLLIYALVFLSGKKNGTAAACISADIAAIHKIEASYKIPKRKLPINQDTPNPVSKIPYPTALSCLGTIAATAAFSVDSCAPIPIPQRRTPAYSQQEDGAIKIKNTKGIDSNVDHARDMVPYLS